MKYSVREPVKKKNVENSTQGSDPPTPSSYGKNIKSVKYFVFGAIHKWRCNIRVATGTERAPNIEQVIAAWPRPGQARPQSSASHLHICII